jgi:hypothetical protein
VPEQFIVETVLKREEWEGDYGPMTTYRLVVNGGKEVDLNQKPSTPAPTQGQEIPGYLKPGKYRPILKKEQAGSTGTSVGGNFKGKSPDQQASIVRQHSQESALRYHAQLGDKPTLENLRETIDWFVDDANKAAQGGGGEASHTQASSSSALAPSQDGVHQRLAELLEGAGVNSAAARVVTDYLISERSVEEQDTALHRLENPNTAAACVKRFSELAEQHYGEPLPETTAADESLPF